MDGPQFDAWTRRRLGLAAGGAFAALCGIPAREDVAGKKRKKKRCKDVFRACTNGGKHKCCKGLLCDRLINEEKHCCRPEGKDCSTGTDLECCDGLVCDTNRCLSETPSDRALKDNFGSVDPADMLQRVRALPISTWNYRGDDASVRHIGPMAQDFAAAFGTGADDRHIHAADGQGVALAAIQGLANLVAELRAENARLAARIAALEAEP